MGAMPLALTAVLVGLGIGGCGGDSDKSREPDTTVERNDAELRKDAERFIPSDINQDMKKAGLRFRARSAECEAATEKGSGRCTLSGSDGREYDVELTIDPKDGSYEYECRGCP